MLISRNILQTMVNIRDIDPGDLALKLTMSTAEIETIEHINAHFGTIYTGKILEVLPHPNADKLTLVDVDCGREKYRVVCGAPNHKKGDIVPVATVGTRFTEEFTVNRTKIRGEESAGMLCSERELGLSDDHSGIMIFPENTPAGVTLAELYPERIDVCFEIDNKSITHRPDLWSHQGFAREIGAIYGRAVRDPVDLSLKKDLKESGSLKVTIKDPEGAPRYSGLVVNNITIGESPEWLKAMVSSVGMRPINNIVDVTNYVMVELGEPMHAFDRKKLRGDEIIVRMAGTGEKITTLDEQEFELMAEDIVIADSGGAVALAGVMGGANSEIDESTTEIVLEAANFNPVNIRKTAQRYNQRTEAAIRFEKSLSPELTELALLRCYQLIKEILPEAEAGSGIVDAYPDRLETITVDVSTDLVRRRLGENISDERIIEILTSLDFGVEESDGLLAVTVPHYRATKDVNIPEDIIEEVGRVHGFDNISEQAPMVPCRTPDFNEHRRFERAVKDILSSVFNMVEVSSYSFVGEENLNRLGINDDRELRLRNPLSMEQDRLRTSLLPNLMDKIVLNQKYRDRFMIYELGRIYLKKDRSSPDLADERTMITGIVYKRNPEEPLFYNAKRISRGLIDKLMIPGAVFVPGGTLPPYAHPARSAGIQINGDIAGIVTELHPTVRNSFELTGDMALFEINGDILFQTGKKDFRFVELQKFPPVSFEVSILAGKYDYIESITSLITGAGIETVRNVEPVSIYEGDPIPEGKKSVSLKIIFAARDRTLAPEEIDKLQKDVIALLNRGGYSLR